VAVRFALEGARVIASDVDHRLTEYEWRPAHGGEVVAQLGDVGRAEDCVALADRALELWGRLDGLVNCAGIVPRSPIETMDEVSWDAVIRTNLSGAFLLSRAAVTAIRRHGDGGSLVHIGSVGGIVGMPNLSGYAASKGGVISLVRQLAIELAIFGIRVNCVCPGATDTPAFHARPDLPDQVSAERARDNFPLLKFRQRLIQPAEIADAVLFLSSDEAQMITGVALPVDGGYLAQ
jgi:3-oxoacyl-[acyl-carrier protein] reductase